MSGSNDVARDGLGYPVPEATPTVTGIVFDTEAVLSARISIENVHDELRNYTKSADQAVKTAYGAMKSRGGQASDTFDHRPPSERGSSASVAVRLLDALTRADEAADANEKAIARAAGSLSSWMKDAAKTQEKHDKEVAEGMNQ